MFKLITNLFKKKQKPKYVNCLQHRTWLQRQVDNEMLKRQAKDNSLTLGKDKESEWYERYL